MTVSWSREELNGSVGERFLRVAARVPEAEAVAATDARLTYRELRDRANCLAARIRLVARPGEHRVAVLCGADSSRIVAMMGALLAGGTLVVLDARSPAAWNARLLVDCDAGVLLFDAGQQQDARALALERGSGSIALLVVDAPITHTATTGAAVGGRDLAAIIYTSGSTGRPKGVMRPHDSFLHTAWLHGDVGGVGERDRFGSIGAAGFARATGDVFAALLNGACLCLYDFGRHGIGGLAQWLAVERITALNLPMAVAREWNGGNHSPVGLPTLRDIRFSGALVHRRDVEQLASTLLGPWRVWAAYSSSEGGLIARSRAQEPGALPNDVLDIGSAVSDRTIALVDGDGRPVQQGAVGELVVSGAFLATGYWNDPAVTAARFTARDGGGATYRTGDVGYRDAHGQLHLAGRCDDMIKVRGFSVIPADIESTLLAWPRIAQAAVLPIENARGERELAAYVVPAAASDTLTEADVRDHVERHRPVFMVPRRVVLLGRMPTLTSGKPDRQALQRLVPATTPAPESDARTTVARVTRAWSDVLGCPLPDVDATFVELGGDSFAVAQLERRLSELFERPLELGGLLAHPTIRAQAAWLDALLDGRAPSVHSPVRIRALEERPAGSALYMLPGVDGSLAYALQFARIATTLSVYGIEPPLSDDGSFDATTFDNLAAPMAACIAAHAQGRPVSLMGPCGGGKLGLEVAVHLQALGAMLSAVVVVDAPGARLPSSWNATRARGVAAWGWQALRTIVDEIAASGVSRALQYMRATVRVAARRVTRPLTARGTTLERRRSTQFRVMSQAHERATYAFPVLLVRGAWSQLGLQMAGIGESLGWDRHCPNLTTRFTPGTHASMYQPPFVEALARIVQEEIVSMPVAPRTT